MTALKSARIASSSKRAGLRPVATGPGSLSTKHELPDGYQPTLLYVTTHPISMRRFLEGQLSFLRESGFKVFALSCPGKFLQDVERNEGVKTIGVRMRREINPAIDLLSLVSLIWYFWRLKPDIVNAGTPKAGLLSMIAAWINRVPIRFYVLHGLRLETARGAKRQLLWLAERIASGCAHTVICVSESLRRKYIQLGLASPGKLLILGHGSANGIDPAQFELTAEGETEVLGLRHSLGLKDSDLVIGFVGRFTRDKGICELLQAFEILLQRIPDVRLLMIGESDATDPLPAETLRRLESNRSLILPGFVEPVAPYYHLMDVLAFPSYREGLPYVPLEAAAAGLPVAGFRATGTIDVVVDGCTGRLVEPGDALDLARVLEEYLKNPSLRRRHGEAAKKRVDRFYKRQIIWTALRDEYAKQLLALRTR